MSISLRYIAGYLHRTQWYWLIFGVFEVYVRHVSRSPRVSCISVGDYVLLFEKHLGNHAFSWAIMSLWCTSNTVIFGVFEVHVRHVPRALRKSCIFVGDYVLQFEVYSWLCTSNTVICGWLSACASYIVIVQNLNFLDRMEYFRGTTIIVRYSVREWVLAR